jgi:organic radical activating enzyme
VVILEGDLNLVEIFSSVQGEGTHAGASTLFIRFGECDLRCRWCDTPQSWKPTAECQIETERGAGAFRTLANPVSLSAAVAAVEALELESHRFVSFTGGEPLLQPEALRALARGLRGRGPRIYLETHGLCADALAEILGDIDVVSMDWKLASDVRRASDPRRGPVEDFHAAHEAFLRVALGAPEVMVKVVVTPTTGDAEIDEMTRRIARVEPEVPVIIQPVTPYGVVRETPSAKRLLALVARMERTLRDVRLIPQTHKLYGGP